MADVAGFKARRAEAQAWQAARARPFERAAAPSYAPHRYSGHAGARVAHDPGGAEAQCVARQAPCVCEGPEWQAATCRYQQEQAS